MRIQNGLQQAVCRIWGAGRHRSGLEVNRAHASIPKIVASLADIYRQRCKDMHSVSVLAQARTERTNRQLLLTVFEI